MKITFEVEGFESKQTEPKVTKNMMKKQITRSCSRVLCAFCQSQFCISSCMTRQISILDNRYLSFAGAIYTRKQELIHI